MLALYQKSHSFAALTRTISDTLPTRVKIPYARAFHEVISISRKRTGLKTEPYNHTSYKIENSPSTKIPHVQCSGDHVCQPRDLSTCHTKMFKICNAKLNVTQQTKIIRERLRQSPYLFILIQRIYAFFSIYFYFDGVTVRTGNSGLRRHP